MSQGANQVNVASSLNEEQTSVWERFPNDDLLEGTGSIAAQPEAPPATKEFVTALPRGAFSTYCNAEFRPLLPGLQTLYCRHNMSMKLFITCAVPGIALATFPLVSHYSTGFTPTTVVGCPATLGITDLRGFDRRKAYRPTPGLHTRLSRLKSTLSHPTAGEVSLPQLHS